MEAAMNDMPPGADAPLDAVPPRLAEAPAAPRLGGAMDKVLPAVSSAMAAVKRIHKDGSNQHDRYKFASIDNFLEALNPILAAAGLIVHMQEVACEETTRQGRNGTTAWLKITFEVTAYHTSGQSMPPAFRSVEVVRSGAQAYGAAQSYVLKQYLRSLLLVPTGDKDDPDFDARDEEPVSRGAGEGRPAADPPRDDAPKFDPAGAAERIKAKLLAAPTMDDLAERWRSEAQTIKAVKDAAPALHAAIEGAKNTRKDVLSKSIADEIPF